jgi:hypothetical protein
MPGWVDAKVIRAKLSKQLRIDLEPSEQLYVATSVLSYDELLKTPHVTKEADSNTVVFGGESPTKEFVVETELDHYVQHLVSSTQPDDLSVRIQQLGTYIAVIGLRGPHYIPLRVEIRKR